MPRTLTTGINTEISRSGSFPIYLVRILTKNGTLIQLNNGDRDFSYFSIIWCAADFQVTQIGFDGTLIPSVKIQFGDGNTAIWTLACMGELDDAVVTVWQAYAAASGDAEPLFIGRVGSIARDASAMTCDIEVETGATTLDSPRLRVEDVVDQAFLIAPGSVIIVGNQRWIIDRSKDEG